MSGINSKRENPVTTVLVITVGFTITYLATDLAYWLYASVGIGIIGILSVSGAILVHRAWMGLGRILAFIVPNVLLSLVFFLIVWPLAMLSGLFRGFDPLKIRRPSASSLFKVRNKIFVAEDFENPW